MPDQPAIFFSPETPISAINIGKTGSNNVMPTIVVNAPIAEIMTLRRQYEDVSSNVSIIYLSTIISNQSLAIKSDLSMYVGKFVHANKIECYTFEFSRQNIGSLYCLIFCVKYLKSQ